VIFLGLRGTAVVCTVSIVHSRSRESHRKQMHVVSPSLLEWNHVMRVPLQGCPKSECRLTCVRMQWVHWTNLRALSTLCCHLWRRGACFAYAVSSPRMDYSVLTLRIMTKTLFLADDSPNALLRPLQSSGRGVTGIEQFWFGSVLPLVGSRSLGIGLSPIRAVLPNVWDFSFYISNRKCKTGFITKTKI
jgi:hypothetical protein